MKVSRFNDIIIMEGSPAQARLIVDALEEFAIRHPEDADDVDDIVLQVTGIIGG